MAENGITGHYGVNGDTTARMKGNLCIFVLLISNIIALMD